MHRGVTFNCTITGTVKHLVDSKRNGHSDPNDFNAEKWSQL